MDFKLAVAVITKDEERCIARCIAHLAGKFDEYIFVDTGSVDNTASIISAFCSGKPSETIFITSPWNDSFSEARNTALDACTADAVLFIDADEILESSRDIIYQEFFRLAAIENSNQSVLLCPLIKNNDHNFVTSVRRGLFLNRGYFFFGYVHEEIRKVSSESVSYKSKITILHDGYSDVVLSSKNKQYYYTKLNLKNIAIEPDNLRWYFFYFRDGFDQIDKRELYTVLSDKIKLNPRGWLSQSNLVNSPYTFPCLDLMAKSMLSDLNAGEDFLIILDLMDSAFPGNSNSFFFRRVYEISKWKQYARKTLKEIAVYKASNLACHNEMLDSSGLHVDALLGFYLYENGKKSQASAVLNSVKSMGFQSELVDDYLNLI